MPLFHAGIRLVCQLDRRILSQAQHLAARNQPAIGAVVTQIALKNALGNQLRASSLQRPPHSRQIRCVQLDLDFAQFSFVHHPLSGSSRSAAGRQASMALTMRE